MNLKHIFVLATIAALALTSEIVFEELGDLKEVTEAFKQKQTILLVLKNKNDEATDKAFTFLERQLKTTYKETLPFIRLRISNCEKLANFCEAEQLDPNTNYVSALRQSVFRTFPLSLKLDLGQVLFKVVHAKTDVDLSKVNLLDKGRLTILFNYPNNSTVENPIKEVIGYINVHSFDLVDFVTITGDPFDLYELNLEKNTQKTLMASDQKLIRLAVQEFNEVEIVQAVNWELNHDVEDFTIDNYYRIFMSPLRNKIFLIRSNENACQHLAREFEKAALHNRYQDLYINRLLFVDVNLDHINKSRYPTLNNIMYAMAGEDFLKSRDCTVLINGLKNNDNLKFLKETELESSESILEFVEAYNSNKLENRFYKSELPGEEFIPGTMVIWVRGSTFRKDIVQHESSDFLLVCRDLDLECRVYSEFLSLISEKLSDPLIRFATLNLKKNDVPTIRAEVLPAMLFYQKGRKSRPEVLTKKFDYANVFQFINQFLNKIEKLPVKLYKSDLKVLLERLTSRFPDDFLSIKKSFDEGAEFAEENDFSQGWEDGPAKELNTDL